LDHVLRGDLILLLREEVGKLVHNLDDPTDAELMDAWMELGKAGVYIHPTNVSAVCVGMTN
jgi:hypothetical protein